MCWAQRYRMARWCIAARSGTIYKIIDVGARVRKISPGYADTCSLEGVFGGLNLVGFECQLHEGMQIIACIVSLDSKVSTLEAEPKQARSVPHVSVQLQN